VQANLAGVAEVTQDASGCTLLPPNASCTLKFSAVAITPQAVIVPVSGVNSDIAYLRIKVAEVRIVAVSPINTNFIRSQQGVVTVRNDAGGIDALGVGATMVPSTSPITPDRTPSSPCPNIAPGGTCEIK